MTDDRIQNIIEEIKSFAPVIKAKEVDPKTETKSYMPNFGDDFSDPTSNFKESLNGALADKEEAYQTEEMYKDNIVDQAKVVRVILQAMTDKFIYYRYGGFTKSELRDSRLYNDPDRDCEDLIISKFEDIKFRRADVYTTVESKFGNYRKYSALYEFDFGKTFQNDVVLFKGVAGRGTGLKKFKTLNKKFNKTFSILAKSQYDSLLVLTPHVMEYLITLDEKYKEKLELTFVDYKLYIKINDQNLFGGNDEIHFVKEEKVREFISEMNDIKDLIVFLKNVALVNNNR